MYADLLLGTNLVPDEVISLPHSAFTYTADYFYKYTTCTILCIKTSLVCTCY